METETLPDEQPATTGIRTSESEDEESELRRRKVLSENRARIEDMRAKRQARRNKKKNVKAFLDEPDKVEKPDPKRWLKQKLASPALAESSTPMPMPATPVFTQNLSATSANKQLDSTDVLHLDKESLPSKQVGSVSSHIEAGTDSIRIQKAGKLFLDNPVLGLDTSDIGAADLSQERYATNSVSEYEKGDRIVAKDTHLPLDPGEGTENFLSEIESVDEEIEYMAAERDRGDLEYNQKRTETDSQDLQPERLSRQHSYSQALAHKSDFSKEKYEDDAASVAVDSNAEHHLSYDSVAQDGAKTSSTQPVVDKIRQSSNESDYASDFDDSDYLGREFDLGNSKMKEEALAENHKAGESVENLDEIGTIDQRVESDLGNVPVSSISPQSTRCFDQVNQEAVEPDSIEANGGEIDLKNGNRPQTDDTKSLRSIQVREEVGKSRDSQSGRSTDNLLPPKSAEYSSSADENCSVQSLSHANKSLSEKISNLVQSMATDDSSAAVGMNENLPQSKMMNEKESVSLTDEDEFTIQSTSNAPLETEANQTSNLDTQLALDQQNYVSPTSIPSARNLSKLGSSFTASASKRSSLSTSYRSSAIAAAKKDTSRPKLSSAPKSVPTKSTSTNATKTVASVISSQIPRTLNLIRKIEPNISHLAASEIFSASSLAKKKATLQRTNAKFREASSKILQSGEEHLKGLLSHLTSNPMESKESNSGGKNTDKHTDLLNALEKILLKATAADALGETEAAKGDPSPSIALSAPNIDPMEVENIQKKLDDVEAENRKLRDEIAFLENLREEQSKATAGVAVSAEGVEKALLNSASREEIEKIRKEIQEQESLIKGYQLENERLTTQLKAAKKQLKETESRSFLRIETLQREIGNLKQNASNTTGLNTAPHAITSDTQAGITEVSDSSYTQAKLAARVDELEEKLVQQERDFCDKETQMLGQNMKLTALLSDATKTIESFKGCSQEEVEALKGVFGEEKHKLERCIVELETRLEREVSLRQMLLDKERFASEQSILESYVRAGVDGTQIQKSKALSKGRSSVTYPSDRKRVKELEKLVVELQERLSRSARGMSQSMTELILEHKPSIEEATYIRHLKETIQRLQIDLETRETSWNERLQSLRAEMEMSKAKYEDKVRELQIRAEETQAASVQAIAAAADSHRDAVESASIPYASHLHDLESQLEILLSRYHEKLTEATDAEISAHLESADSAITRAFKAREVKLRTRISELESTLEHQMRTIESMRADRAVAEREALLRNQMRDALITSYENKITTLRKEIHDQVFVEEEQKMLGEIQRLRMELQGIQSENLDLKNRLEVSEATRKSVHENTIAILKQAQEESAKIALAHHERALSMLRDETKTATAAFLDAEIRRLQLALTEAETEVTRWRAKATALEGEKNEWEKSNQLVSEMPELQFKLAQLQDHVQDLQVMNRDLQHQLEKAKSSWPPDRRRFMHLENMLIEMEAGFQKRENDLRQLMEVTRRDANAEVTKVKARYVPLLEQRDREILYFRDEMDQLVQALEQLGKRRMPR